MTDGYDLGYESAYWFYFPDRAGAERAATDLKERGLAVLDPPTRLEGEGEWVVGAWDRAHEHRLDVPFEEIARSWGGRYEGCRHSVAPNLSFACRVPQRIPGPRR